MDTEMHHHSAGFTGTLLWIGLAVLVLAVAGYWWAARIAKENSSQLKKAQKAVLKQKRRTVLWTSNGLLAAAVVLVGIYGIQFAGSRYDIELLNHKAAIDVRSDKDYGRGHTDQPVNYELKIPTSGSHSPHDLKYGFYTERPPYEKLVHNLEHGDIEIHYRTDASPEVIDRLKYLTNFRKAGSGVLAVPSTDIPANDQVVVTAWTKTMELTGFDETKIGTFIYDYINKGPEVIPPEIRQGGGTM